MPADNEHYDAGVRRRPCTGADEAAVHKSQDADDPRRSGAGWPIDDRAMRDLLARVERLACTAAPGDDNDRVRRLDILRGHASAASGVFDPEVAAAGRCVTIGDQDERIHSLWLALPGDEHATANTISIAAPTGLALAGARVGDVVHLETGGRRRWAVILSVT